jgi:DNA modification methylase
VRLCQCQSRRILFTAIASKPCSGSSGARSILSSHHRHTLTSTTKPMAASKPDKYVEWFLARSDQFLRVLKPTGSFVLNIKEKAENGEQHVYVLELILTLCKQGWLWTEEYIWHKRNCHPGKWPNRFRDSWERCICFHRNVQRKFYIGE